VNRVDTAGKEWRGKALGWQPVRRPLSPRDEVVIEGGFCTLGVPLCTCGVKSPDPAWHADSCPIAGALPIEQSPQAIPNPPNWPFDLSYDFAEWMTRHTVVRLSKHIDDQTGVISTIFHAEAGGCYAYDAFETYWHGPDLTFMTEKSSAALLRLATPILQWFRHAAERKERARRDAITL
jgi:hypothetical protein